MSGGEHIIENDILHAHVAVEIEDLQEQKEGSDNDTLLEFEAEVEDVVNEHDEERKQHVWMA